MERKTSSYGNPIRNRHHSYDEETVNLLSEDDLSKWNNLRTVRRYSIYTKFIIISTAMILFFVLLYIPVYNRANKDIISIDGWNRNTNRNAQVYVHPVQITTLHNPNNVCTSEKDALFLLIIVCSATDNFEARKAIRKTWGDYQHYLNMKSAYIQVESRNITLVHNSTDDGKPNMASLMSDLAEALSSVQKEQRAEEFAEEERFSDEKTLDKLMETTKASDETAIDYDYESNVMKIPAKGDEESNKIDIYKLAKKVKLFKINSTYDTLMEPEEKRFEYEENISANGNAVEKFKVAFMLGLPVSDVNGTIQQGINEEWLQYGDVIQENFVDSYNNLTLKSILMLKWITMNCKGRVRYIMKTDDDMFINTVNLIDSLERRSSEYDKSLSSGHGEEYLLVGDLIRFARPVTDTNNKWYSPRYMYAGRMYPKYLSGTGYTMSYATAAALFRASLITPLFHLEDIYITGMCSAHATPHIRPQDSPGYSYIGFNNNVCSTYRSITVHRVDTQAMSDIVRELSDVESNSRCLHETLVAERNEQQRRLNLLRKKTEKIMNFIGLGRF